MALTELRNVEADLHRFRRRALVLAAVIAACFLLLLLRLIYLQVIRHDELQAQAEVNRTTIVPLPPARGLILDRNGIPLATNYSAYTLEITPSEVEDLPKTIDELAELVEITPRDRQRFRRLMQESRGVESLPIRIRLSDEEVARFTVQRYRFKGVELRARLLRNYPWGELGSHVVGYIGRINRSEKRRIDSWPAEEQANYRGTDYIGKLGVEQSFEKQLHGQTGFERVETTAGGIIMRTLASQPDRPGDNVLLSIDIKLQHLVEQMFGDRRGALVAMDPSNGEILAFVSKPTFDPNIFVEGVDQEAWQELNESIEKPLLNRALRGIYPPGSTYKPFMALAALELGKREPHTTIVDTGSWTFGGHTYRSHGDYGLGPIDMHRSIVKSSNVYYYMLANDLGVEAIHDFMKPLGFGQLTGIDIHGEVRGVLPNLDWKRRAFKQPAQQRWYSGETVSLGVGQGYNTFTMLQLATATATVANDGVRHRPHLVVGTQDPQTLEMREVVKSPPTDLGYSLENLKVIQRAMVDVTRDGTSARSFAGAKYQSAGKTGTAQAVSISQKEKYDARKLEEHQRDHALYIAYAPAEAPRIALALVIENAGWGAQQAAPIARRVFDYWLLGLYPSVEDLYAVRQGLAAYPIGRPRDAATVAWPPRKVEDEIKAMGGMKRSWFQAPEAPPQRRESVVTEQTGPGQAAQPVQTEVPQQPEPLPGPAELAD
jgi:penicillin-binding protein 2